jgi:hypothetical protein
VALHASQRLWKEMRSGPKLTLITLATPFIHARKRQIGGLGQPMILASALLMPVSGLIYAIHDLDLWPPSWRNWALLGAAACVGIVLFLFILGTWVHREQFGSGFLDSLIKSIHAPTTSSGKVIVIRAAGDEAAGTITAGQFLAGLSSTTTRVLTGLYVLSFLLLLVQVPIVLAAIFSIDWLAKFGLWAMLYFFAPIYTVIGVALIATCGASLVFGTDGPFVAAFASCSAEAAPPGKPDIYQLQPFAGKERKGLSHSRLYDHEPAVDYILSMITRTSATSWRHRKASR